MSWLLGGFLALLVSMLSYRLKYLSRDGALTAFLMGWLIFGLGKVAFSVVVLVFFFSSSILSKVGRARKEELRDTFQKSGERDFAQVLANGGIPTVMLIAWFFSHNPAFVWLFLASLAAATADTWATEIGVLSRTAPRAILGFERVPKGTSGAISLTGSAGALAGAFLVASLGLFVFSLSLNFSVSLRKIIIITLIGFAAQMVDSFLGATLQVKYKCIGCGAVSERRMHCSGKKTRIVSGLQWMDNDVVNGLAAVFSVLLGWSSLVLMEGP
ncbi:MAG: DUF92 domain-containing protein [bacterium]